MRTISRLGWIFSKRPFDLDAIVLCENPAIVKQKLNRFIHRNGSKIIVEGWNMISKLPRSTYRLLKLLRSFNSPGLSLISSWRWVLLQSLYFISIFRFSSCSLPSWYNDSVKSELPNNFSEQVAGKETEEKYMRRSTYVHIIMSLNGYQVSSLGFHYESREFALSIDHLHLR